MTLLTISSEGPITLSPEISQLNTWQNIDQLVMLHLGDILVLRPAHALFQIWDMTLHLYTLPTI